jgi:hypothetical protein
MPDEINDIPPSVQPGMDRTYETFVQVHRLAMVIIVKKPNFIDSSRGQDFWKVDSTESLCIHWISLCLDKTPDSWHPAL